MCTDPPPLTGTVEDFCNGLGGEMRTIQHTEVKNLGVVDNGGAISINP
jgi:hypothetical protein